MIESRNPFTETVLETFAEDSEATLERRLESAEQTFDSWAETALPHRSQCLLKVAERLADEKDELARVIVEEMGKPVTQAVAEVEKCALVCRYYAEHAAGFLAPEMRRSDAAKSYVRQDPLGPVLAIMPWNFPFWQVFRFAAPALMAGNVGLLKHASNVPRCALSIQDVFLRSGLPEGAFQTLLVSAETTLKLIRDRRVKAVTLTGSEEAGRQVARTAGDVLKKCVLELGGSDAFIVLEDADIREVARVATLSRCLNNGQSCIAAKRFIVLESVVDTFTDALTTEMSRLKTGDPSHPETDLGPLARSDLRDLLHRQAQATVREGGRLETGGVLPDGRGYFYPPTVISGVTPEMTAGREELFGPVAALMVASDEKCALQLANASRFGLGASIWTRDVEKAEHLATRIHSGSVFVNGMVKSDPRLPFGGIKDSGFGRELSVEGIREFTNCKTVSIG